MHTRLRKIMLSGYPYGRTQHISVIYYVSTQFCIYHVMSGSAICLFLLELPTGQFNTEYHLFSNYNSMFVMVKIQDNIGQVVLFTFNTSL